MVKYENIYLFIFGLSQVGFEMIDAFAKSQGIPMDTVHFKAIFGKGFLSASFDILVFCFSFNACCNL